jgi:hypothetical protein
MTLTGTATVCAAAFHYIYTLSEIRYNFKNIAPSHHRRLCAGENSAMFVTLLVTTQVMLIFPEQIKTHNLSGLILGFRC